MQYWRPPHAFQASDDDYYHVLSIPEAQTWTKPAFHAYFKRVELNLLKKFRKTINSGDKPTNKQTHAMQRDWRRLALLRDYHDYMCERDRKHHIRTDDCRRFIACVLKGIMHGRFAMPVTRMLTGCGAPRGFTHPRFVQFN
jgi:hypothetical protein